MKKYIGDPTFTIIMTKLVYTSEEQFSPYRLVF